MRFQTKLLVSYSLIIVLLVIGLGIGFYGYSAGVFERNARANLLTVSDRMAQQLDNLVKPMDFITTYLLSDSDFYSAMTSIGYLDRGEESNLMYVNEGWRLVRSTLQSYSIGRNFRAVNVFNRAGDFLSSNLEDFAGTSDPRPLMASIAWIRRADAESGRAVLIPPYADPWSGAAGGGAKVYGLARAAIGPKGPMGYIEVQNELADLEKLFSVPSAEEVRVLAFLADGSPFYAAGFGDAELAYYSGLAGDREGRVRLARDPVTGKEAMVAAASAPYAGVSVLLVQDKESLLRPLRFTRNLAVLVGLLIILVSLAYNFLFSRQLAGPIHALKTQMEGTELGNLPDRIPLENSNDEIEALNAAFLRLRSRLGDSMKRELVSQSLEARARFDSLQAQVSPHFLYNILTVIANKGLEAGSEEICEICDGIASMLRYSTSTTERFATVEEELAHVRSYLFLMKKRLEHRLDFEIGVDPALLGERIPKIVLQQVAENSISHGFGGGKRPLRIEIRGRALGERWRIEISDDGPGFDPAVLSSLRERIGGLARPQGDAPSHGAEIGGMGLVNLYSRLALFYRGDFDFDIGGGSDAGAVVGFGARFGSGGDD